MCYTVMFCVLCCSNDTYYSHVLLFFFCLCILHQSCLTITAGTANCPVLNGIGFQSTPPLEGAGVFNVPEGDSPQNTEPPFIA